MTRDSGVQSCPDIVEQARLLRNGNGMIERRNSHLTSRSNTLWFATVTGSHHICEAKSETGGIDTFVNDLRDLNVGWFLKYIS